MEQITREEMTELLEDVAGLDQVPSEYVSQYIEDNNLADRARRDIAALQAVEPVGVDAELLVEILSDYASLQQDGVIDSAGRYSPADAMEQVDLLLTASPAPEHKEEWISVDERLPEPGITVMVYTPPQPGDYADDVRIGFDGICPESDGDYWLDHGEHYEHYSMVAKGGEGWTGPSAKAPYTHWMPLPSLPRQEDAKRYLVYQVGCIECGVSSYPIKTCETLEEAEAVQKSHPSTWDTEGGDGYVTIIDVARCKEVER